MNEEEWLGQIFHDGTWMDYARGHEAESRRWQAGDPTKRRLVHWISKEVLVAESGDSAEAHVEVTPSGDKIGKVTFESVELTIYRSPEDAAFVVEIDTQTDTGEIRVYVNDGQIFAADPEVG